MLSAVCTCDVVCGNVYTKMVYGTIYASSMLHNPEK